MTSTSKIWKELTSILSNLNNFHSLSCGSRQRDTTSSEWKFKLNNLAVNGLILNVALYFFRIGFSINWAFTWINAARFHDLIQDSTLYFKVVPGTIYGWMLSQRHIRWPSITLSDIGLICCVCKVIASINFLLNLTAVSFVHVAIVSFGGNFPQGIETPGGINWISQLSLCGFVYALFTLIQACD